MPFQKGKSGNPDGRPPSGQAYSEILRKAGSHRVDYQGKKVARKRLLAEYLWQLAVYRKVTFPDGSTITPDPEGWLDVIWRIFAQLDGLPTQNIDVTSGGEKVRNSIIEVMPVDYRIAIAPLAPGPMDDSAAPVEGESSLDGEKVG